MANASITKGRQAADPEGRRQRVADAALAVLAEQGSRGLTHRAVDEAAGLPSGSTSNHFRTREALLEAAARRHAELDQPPAGDVDGVVAATEPLNAEQTVQLVMAALDQVLSPAARPMLAARYELILEASRRPALHEVMAGSRSHFIGLAELLLRAGGCKSPESHSAQLIALMDGITSDQLQDNPSTLDRAGIEETVARFLSTC